MLFADSFKDYSKGYFLDCEDCDLNKVEEQFYLLERKAAIELKNNSLEFEWFIDARYKNQSHELTVKYSSGFIGDFHKLHLTRYGFNSLNKGVEIVNIRVKAFIRRSQQTLPKISDGKKEITRDIIDVFTGNRETGIICYKREDFYHGFKFNGPCIVVEETSTVYIPGGFSCRIDEYGNIISSYY